MKSNVRFVIVAAVVTLTAVGCNSSSSDGSATPKSGPSPQTAEATGIVSVKVDGDGFSPSQITVKKGDPVTLRLTRSTDQTCAKRVAFPELKIEEDLPLGKAVDISLPSEEARTLAFQCGMGMYKGAVVIN